MKKKIEYLVALLHSERPRYYLDIIDANTNVRIKYNYDIVDIKQENDNVFDWFLALPANSIYVKKYLKTGTSRIKKGEKFLLDLESLRLPKQATTNQVIQEPTSISMQQGLNGLNAPQLMANTMFLKKLEVEHEALKKRHEYLEEKYKAKLEKLKDKYKDAKEQLLIATIKEANKPLVSSEMVKSFLDAAPNVLASLQGQGAGLNAPEENLTETQKDFIVFVKQQDDATIEKIFQLYIKSQEDAKN